MIGAKQGIYTGGRIWKRGICRILWLLPLLTTLACPAALAEGFTWKPRQGRPLEWLNIEAYPGDPLYQAIERVKERERRLAGEMVRIPAGSFHMGSNEGDGAEKPVQPVTIQPFLLGKYEVTQAQWWALMGSNPSRFSDCDDCPVENVSWDDVQRFIEQINRQTGGGYRLPTEAEWEYAARARSTTKYSWGNEIGSGMANCDGCGSRWDDERTAPVGSFRPNGFGLHDMHGNVWEWTEDCWNDSYEGAPMDGTAWLSGECGRRVMRGGSWLNGPGALRSANRWFGRDARNGYRGFRLASTPAEHL